MYDHNDRIAEELSNYCTDLREQLKDAKASITWVCSSKVEVQEKLATAEDTLRKNEVAIDQYEDANKVLGERVKFLESLLDGALS